MTGNESIQNFITDLKNQYPDSFAMYKVTDPLSNTEIRTRNPDADTRIYITNTDLNGNQTTATITIDKDSNNTPPSEFHLAIHRNEIEPLFHNLIDFSDDSAKVFTGIFTGIFANNLNNTPKTQAPAPTL